MLNNSKIKVATTEDNSFKSTNSLTASIDDLVKNKVEVKFTVRMANGVLSENGNSEETYTLTFAIQK